MHSCRSFAVRLSPLSRSSSVKACREAIELNNASLNALVHVAPETTASTNPNLPLHDLVLAVKDNFCTTSMPTTCSSAMLSGFYSPFDATAVLAIQQAGAHIVGKTNCDEFGMGSLNIYSVHGAVVNPHPSPFSTSENRSAGGSSGGSAAAVAAGMCDAALATDTGGSTRLPASYCGVVGLKPSFGVISRWGVVAFADSLDCVGIIAKDVAITRRVFDTLSFHDPKDPTAATPETRRTCSEVLIERMQCIRHDDDLTSLRVGVPIQYFPRELSSSVIPPLRRVLSGLQSLGATLVPVSLPSTSFALSAYYVIASAEASSNMARYDGVQFGAQSDSPLDADKTVTAKVYARTRSQRFGPEVKRRILLGTYALSADAFDNYFLQAQKVRKRVREDFMKVFRMPYVLSPHIPLASNSPKVDVLIHPSAIGTAPPLPSSPSFEPSSPLDAYVQDVLNVPASLAGLPALSVPAGFAEDGYPVGVSIVGQWGGDELVIWVGAAVEKLVMSASI